MQTALHGNDSKRQYCLRHPASSARSLTRLWKMIFMEGISGHTLPPLTKMKETKRTENVVVYFIKALGWAFVDAIREPATTARAVAEPSYAWDSMVGAASEEWVDPTVFRFTVALLPGVGYPDLAASILNAARSRPDLDTLQTHLAAQYAISEKDALTAIDRALGGVVRAASLSPLACPDAAIDPVAAAAFALATHDTTIIDSIYPGWREWRTWEPSSADETPAVTPVPRSVKREPSRSPLPVRGFTVVLVLGVAWFWYSFISFRPDEVSDYGIVTGTLVSAEEHLSGGRSQSGYLDIQLKQNPIRYCVPADGYLDYFRREAFFAEVSQGAAVELAVRASEIASPRTFVLNATPTAFVRGVRVRNQDYCTVQDHIAWQIENHWWLLGVAVAGSALLVWIFRRKKSPPRSAWITSQSSAAPRPRFQR